MSATIQLNQENLEQLKSVTAVPLYDRSKVKTGIVHIGIGGFHRSHQAFYCDELLASGNDLDWGICGVALLEHDDKIYKTLKKQDGLYTLIIKELDGSWKTRVIGSITEYIYAPENTSAVIEKLASEQTKIITLTITEGGYNYDESTGEFNMENPLIQHDLLHAEKPKTVYGYLTQALKLRNEKGRSGCTIQSCDNIQGNGEVMCKTLLTYIKATEPDLSDWVEANVSFPNSMVDRITPVTEKQDIQKLKDDFGIVDNWPVTCEPFIQWVIEDNFIQGRPQWESVGAEFVGNVAPYEQMKLQLLNAAHSVLGILGALLSYETIDEAVSDNALQKLLSDFMDKEVTPTLKNLSGMNLPAYKKSLVERFGNQNIKDQVSRICSESSAKLPKFLLPTLKEQLKNEGPIDRATFVLAAWAIYSLGKDEQGNVLEVIDAMKETLFQKALVAKKNPASFLELTTVFGNLIEYQRFVTAFTDFYDKILQIGIQQAVIDLNKK